MRTTRRQETPDVLHNMSVPATSRVTVARASLPGQRYLVCLWNAGGPKVEALRDRLGKGGWRAAWRFLELRNDAPRRATKRRRRQDELERHLEESLRSAGIPDRLGVFLDEHDPAAESVSRLSPAAALAVLARRSGPLYLPSRRLEPSLVDPRRSLVLFFPEESR